MRAALAFALRCALLLASGCSAQGFIASPSDYAGYRATRVSPTFELRLAAAQRYLAEHADGRYRDEVRAFFDPAEELFFSARKDTRLGLEGYLAALPKGPHEEQAKRRISEIDAASRSRTAELDRTVAEVEARTSGPRAAERARVRAEVQDWLTRLLDRGTWAGPIAAARPALVVPFSLSLPAPRCALVDPPEGAVARRCTKLTGLPYSVQVERGLEAREATVEITVIQDPRGVPIEATVSGPDLFVRLEETYRVKPVVTGDAEQRAAATARAVEMVRAAFSQAVSAAPSCARKIKAPTVLELGCDGVLVSVRAGAAPGDDDRIVIAPLF
jgi:hypothetical protein